MGSVETFPLSEEVEAMSFFSQPILVPHNAHPAFAIL